MTPDLWYALIPVAIGAIIIGVILRKSGYCKYGCPFLARHAKPNTSKTTRGGRKNARFQMRRNDVKNIHNHSSHRRDSDQDSDKYSDRISTISDGHCGYDGGNNGGGDTVGGDTGGGYSGGAGAGGGGHSGWGDSGGCDTGGDGGDGGCGD